MHKQGFTLVELLAVVLIVGILTAVALPQYRRSLERSRVAEASQMLPAIFDARERLIVEKGLSWNNANPSDHPSQNPELTFANLDISFKGSGNEKMRTTDSFQYKLFDSEYPGTGPVVHQNFVSAKLTRGPFANTMFYYDGSSLSCCNSNLEICDFFNIPHGSSTCPIEQNNPGHDED